jgi:hypothetical protein
MSFQNSFLHSRSKVEVCLLVGLAFFFASNFLPISYSVNANLFYVFGVLPAIFWTFRQPSIFFSWVKSAWPLYGFLAGIVLASLIKGDLEGVKPVIYVLLIGLAMFRLHALGTEALNLVFGCFLAAAVAALIWSSYAWGQAYYISDTLERIQLWGSKHPLHTALLIEVGLVWLWEFKVENLIKNKGKLFYSISFLCFIALAVWAVIPFQARGALVGLLLYLIIKVWMSDYRRQLIVGILFVGILVWVSGIYSVLLERGLSYRPAIWGDAWQRLSHECGVLLGCGKDGHLFAGRWTHAHSAYLMPVYEYGLVVGLPLAIFVFYFFKNGMRARSPWLLVAAIGWGGVLTNTGGVVSSYKPYWVYFWMPTFLTLMDYWCFRLKRNEPQPL